MNVSVADPLAEPRPSYWARRAQVAEAAAGPGRDPATVQYTATEDRVWALVVAELSKLWAEHAVAVAVEGLALLDLDPQHVPQLHHVTARLEPLCGFRFEAVPGLVDTEEFFHGLRDGRFLSTQYVRWEGSPRYTPEPDVIHEVFGHAHVLTAPALAELHRLGGAAYSRLQTPEARHFVADVFWFSAEFGVVRQDGRWRAYGAGLLSSIGELARFANTAEIVGLDIATMGTLPYNIDAYQQRLFGAESLDEVLDVVGGFFATCSDESIQALIARGSQ